MIQDKKVVCVIPARLESSRFPGKPLKDILGLPMIVHVMKRAKLCKDLDLVYVATDSKEICKVIEEHGGQAVMTSKEHRTGSDRIAEAVKEIDCEIVVNVQGDEPLVMPEDISKVVRPLIEDEGLQAATLLCRTNQFNNINECKVVVNLNDEILYFSREDIPSTARVKHDKLLKLYNLVSFRKDFLIKYARWGLSPLEKIEYIEYLRILEHGYKMKAFIVDHDTQSVDTPEELEIVKGLMKKDKIWQQYVK
ncbi:MAG: 3-deoxy-manno-octulosonate cytidylyltransferase [Candidatus Altiarchaeota archaeon]